MARIRLFRRKGAYTPPVGLPLSATQSQTDVQCNGALTGEASVVPSGGTAPYTYLWSNGATTSSINGIAAGSYSVTINDSAAHSIVKNFTITQPTALTATSPQTNVLCRGNATGVATVSPSGGTPPYTYQWNTGATTASITGLVAGSYNVNIFDFYGCTINKAFTITQPAAVLSATQSQTDILCNGSSTGVATVTPAGGTAPYTYLWNTGATTSSITNRPAGSYNVTITDANGCSIGKSFILTQPTVLSATSGKTDVACRGASTGSAFITPTGGTPPYTYLWSNSATTASISNVAAGSYNVTATDANGCTVGQSFTINQPAAVLSATESQTNIACFGGATGAASVTPSGGTAPYTYSWNTGATTSSISNRTAGSYSVTITDASGCTLIKNFVLTQPAAALSASQSQSDVTVNGGSDGSASVTPSGGTTPYTYAWSNGGVASSITGLTAGSYNVTITDANGCTTNKSFTITEPPPASNNYVLSVPSTTSAGVYKSDGETLVRTLWSNVFKAAGTYALTWDGKNDAGTNILGLDTYTAKVLINNVTYTWEKIGNTSSQTTGESVIKYLRAIQGTAISGNNMYYALGFSETSPNQGKIVTTSPQEKIDIMRPINGDANLDCTHVCTDGTIVYWGGFDPFDSQKSFVFGTNVSNDAETLFSSGTSTSVVFGRTYPRALAIITNSSSNKITGLAVGGTYLYVARGSVNQIRVYNKTTGALVTTYTTTMAGLTLSNPREMKVVGSTLWFINGSGDIRTATISGSTLIRTTNFDKTGLTSVLKLDVNAAGTELALLHGGALQVIRGYVATDNSTTVSWTLGQSGGYATDSTVANDKFMFSHSVAYIPEPWVLYTSTNHIWVGDVGNYRYVHFDASRVYVEQIQALKTNYQISGDKNDAKRIFSDYLEFEDNLTSWSLKRNWAGALTADYVMSDLNERNMFKSCTTLAANGRTYAFINWIDPGDETRYPEIVELVTGGVLRFTGIRFDPFQNILMQPNGDVIWVDIDTDNVGSTGSWRRRVRTGFSSNNPTFAAETSYNTFPTIASTDPGYKAGRFTPGITTSNKLVVFSPDKVNTGRHFGVVKLGTSVYLWKVAPSTTAGYNGAFPTDGTFDIGNGVEYAGGDCLVLDNYLWWNYVGEFWKNSQVNKHHMYDHTGLMIGQFGTTGPEAEAITPYASPNMAGNAFSTHVVKVGSDYYVYHNDESYSSAVHRWKISNLSSIDIQTVIL